MEDKFGYCYECGIVQGRGTFRKFIRDSEGRFFCNYCNHYEEPKFAGEKETSLSPSRHDMFLESIQTSKPDEQA